MILATQHMLLLLSVILLTLWYLGFLWKMRRLYFYSRNVPGPFALPIIGAAYHFIGNSDDIIGKMIRIIERYPSPCKIWLGPHLIYSLTVPDHIEKILMNQKCMEKDNLYEFLRKCIGSGLITAPVARWRKHRKIIMPSFNQKILDSFVDTFSEQASIFTDILEAQVGKEDIDIHQLVSALTMDIICETAMGVKINAQKGNCDFAMHLENIMEITTLRIFKIWHHLDWMWRLYPASRVLDKHLAGFHEVTSTVIRKKLEEIKEEKDNRRGSMMDQIEEGGRKGKLAFLDLVMENSGFTEGELMEEVEILLIAGTDTSTTTICFLFTLLGLFPEAQQKVYEEVIEVLGEERLVEPPDFSKFKYLERVIKETLRLFPVGSYFLRQLGEDIDLGKCILPEGSSVIFSLLNIHRNPKYWPDPLKFDPDRFLPEEIAKRHPCTYIPFSYGPRNCIGGKYAMMNMETIMAAAIRKYKFFTKYKSVDEIELTTKIVLRPKHGYKLYLETR